ncbi:MAG: hypothetical protein ACREQO_12925, partial [Candidatus Binatia bacterium]
LPLSLEFGAGGAVLLRISCSRILGSCGKGRRSVSGGGGSGVEVCGARGKGAVLLDRTGIR